MSSMLPSCQSPMERSCRVVQFADRWPMCAHLQPLTCRGNRRWSFNVRSITCIKSRRRTFRVVND
ncbi:hypothetical protein B4U80_05275 [Leptotrombidium deliense]|uniref:Uncharacterized protein n=1 Tax=Leptotrombidium deliense TaxID=299467 RepID=A0A443SMF3_9ACAR|nr:hypothetical protein B4U80_05275 [Leptotrombidium deliense]